MTQDPDKGAIAAAHDEIERKRQEEELQDAKRASTTGSDSSVLTDDYSKRKELKTTPAPAKDALAAVHNETQRKRQKEESQDRKRAITTGSNSTKKKLAFGTKNSKSSSASSWYSKINDDDSSDDSDNDAFSAKKSTPEIIYVLDSDDDDDVYDDDRDDNLIDAFTDLLTLSIPIGRFAIDGHVYYGNFTFEYNPAKETMSIRKSAHCSIKVTDIKLVKNVHYSLRHKREYLSGTSARDIDPLGGFVSFNIPAENVTATKLKPALNRPQNQCITLIVEFSRDSYIYNLKKNFPIVWSTVAVNSAGEIAKKAAPLLKYLKALQKERQTVSPNDSMRVSNFLKDKDTEEVLFEYPLAAGSGSIEAACEGSSELKNGSSIVDSRKPKQVSILVKDVLTLRPTIWLNDNLINLWMLLITRDQPSDVQIFSSLFYTKLSAQGPENVESWSKNFNVFEKKIIIFPINSMFLHWSLCVLINPGAITVRSDNNNCSPVLLFFDSSNLHSRRRIEFHIFKWLSFEFRRFYKRDRQQSYKTFHRLTPKVPKQRNGNDCGVFVLKYAQAICQIKSSLINFSDGSISKHDILSTITNSQHFKFNQTDIDRIRVEFKTVIQSIHRIDLGGKDASDEAKTSHQQKKRAASSAAGTKRKNLGPHSSKQVEVGSKIFYKQAEVGSKISPTQAFVGPRCDKTNYRRDHLELSIVDGFDSDLDCQIPKSIWIKMKDLEKFHYILERVARAENSGGMNDPTGIPETSYEHDQSLDSPHCDKIAADNSYVMFASATPHRSSFANNTAQLLGKKLKSKGLLNKKLKAKSARSVTFDVKKEVEEEEEEEEIMRSAPKNKPKPKPKTITKKPRSSKPTHIQAVLNFRQKVKLTTAGEALNFRHSWDFHCKSHWPQLRGYYVVINEIKRNQADGGKPKIDDMFRKRIQVNVLCLNKDCKDKFIELVQPSFDETVCDVAFFTDPKKWAARTGADEHDNNLSFGAPVSGSHMYAGIGEGKYMGGSTEMTPL